MHQLSKSPIRIALYGLGIISMIIACGTLNNSTVQAQRRSSAGRTAVSIPRGTEMKIRLEKEIDSKESRDGDRFTATVLSPRRYADATIEGHVSRIEQSGKIKGSTQISLSFDRIRLSNGRSGRIPDIAAGAISERRE